MMGGYGFILVYLGQLFSGTAVAEMSRARDNALEELRSVGITVSKAILETDIDLILRYDRPDLVGEDGDLLKNKTSHLYCYLFDSACIKPKRRSVYEILYNAQRLAIVARDLGRGNDGNKYGLLYFFDETIVDRKKLFSLKYLCEKGGKEIITWTFKHVKGKWVSAHPPFDAETDVHCNP